jgi:hypothetical protein
VPRLLADTATVSQLIDVNSKWWNIELLEQLFTKEETIAIKSIPISATDQADRLIWRGTVKGCFSVRSAYYIQKEAEALQQAGDLGVTTKWLFGKHYGSFNYPTRRSTSCGELAMRFYLLETICVPGRLPWNPAVQSVYKNQKPPFMLYGPVRLQGMCGAWGKFFSKRAALVGLLS